MDVQDNNGEAHKFPSKRNAGHDQRLSFLDFAELPFTAEARWVEHY